MRSVTFLLSFTAVFLACATAARIPEQIQIHEPVFLPATPGYQYSFPRDHGSHPDYKVEWWYYTGHLKGSDGRRFGYELTFFRFGLDRRAESKSSWAIDDLHAAHFAISQIEEQQFRSFERLQRKGPGIARTSQGTLDIENSGWSARLHGDVMKLRAYAEGILLEIDLKTKKDPIIHGINGVSQKADGYGRASHYYSMTRMQTQGMLSINGNAIRVSGESWMDHEFGTNQLAPEQIGWDWFSVQLDNEEELMLYQLRNRNGSIDRNSSGTVVAANGRSEHLLLQDFNVSSLQDWKSPKTGVTYRIDWEIKIPSLDAILRLKPLMEHQELLTTRSTGIVYWEGAVEVSGIWKGQAVTGRGFVELTGYSEKDRPNL